MRNTHYKYLVAGAGPAGINAVAKLLKSAINPREILWVDPAFFVGDFGTKWQDVPGNTKVSAYLPWFEMLKKVIGDTASNPKCIAAKAYRDALSIFTKFSAEYTCPLKDAAKPMHWATQHLKTVVDIKVSKAQQLEKYDRNWKIYFSDVTNCYAQCVIIAIGAETKKFSLPAGAECTEILLETASQKMAPQQFHQEGKSIAVIGSSHSAALSVMQLLDSNHSVLWFKRNSTHACRYAEFHAGYTLYDNTGLKGTVALYMKKLEAHPHPQLTIIESNEKNLETYLINCNHVIHAVGFSPRSFPIVADGAVTSAAEIDYDDRTGFAESNYPGLFFHGIGRPTVADELAGRGPVDEKGTRKILMAAEVGVGKFHKVFTQDTIMRLQQYCTP
jgi:thioredoxin reductase